MPKYRIKAYFMHEYEAEAAKEAAAASVISEAEWTTGYVMGVVDKSQLESLSKKGLLISLVEQIESVEQKPAPAVVNGVTLSPAILTSPPGSMAAGLSLPFNKRRSQEKTIVDTESA